MDLPSLGNFLFPYFKTYFMQICCRYLKTRNSNVWFQQFYHVFNVLFPKFSSLKRKAVYTVQNQNYARARSGVRSCCAARTCKPPQEVKVPYFCGPFVVYPQELWNERSQKSSPQEARKLPQASRRRMKFFISVNLKEVCSVCCLFVTTPFCSVDTNSLCGSKR